ncbi:MAG TPA: S53 family peptidase [Candidatus Elarobacter sp.]
MKKLALLAGALGLAASACSGHGSSTLPATAGMRPSAAMSAPSALGARTTRAKSAILAPAGWAATATSAIALANATDLGQLDRSKPVDVVLGLQMRDVDTVKAEIAAAHKMSRATFVGRFAPSSDDVAAAVSYLRGQGFSNVTATPNNMLVSGTAPAAAVEKAFNTTLHAFRAGGGTYFANTQPAFVPASLDGKVLAVLGLTNFPGLKASAPLKPTAPIAPMVFGANGAGSAQPCTKNVDQATGAPVCPRFYDPPTFTITYDVGSTPGAGNTEIAIFTAGDLSASLADFRDNRQQFGLLARVPIQVIQVEPPSGDTSGSTEWTLDLTYSYGMAYTAQRMDVYNVASLSFKDLTVALNRWAGDDIAPVMNASVGGCEVFPYQTGDMLVGDMILVEAAAQGQTLFASTGDTGGYCGAAGVPPNGGVGGVPMVEYPASSPYAVAVGGTDTFSNVDGTYLGEQAWQSGGGGLSQFEYSPGWQQGIQPVGTTPAGSFRGVPDIAYDAALETGALLWQGGTEYITGGTSLASPMAAGVFARLQSSRLNSLGFAAPLLYGAYANMTPQQLNGPPVTQLIGGFHDVLQGTNGDYTALPKYDYTTGLGSIDVERLDVALGRR